MTGFPIIGFVCVLGSGILQGVFLLPLKFATRWQWEHLWLVFSAFGMLILNWLLAVFILPHPFELYGTTPGRDLGELALFGLGSGAGAVLFGLGMERLGLSLGYPIIMGLIASLGAFIPLLIFHPKTLFSFRGALITAGTAAVVGAIVLCSRAGAYKENARKELHSRKAGLARGIAMA